MLRRCLIAAFTFALCLTGQSVSVKTQIELAGSSATVQVISTSTPATIVQFVAASGNSGVSRCGNSAVTSSIGFRLPAGAGQFLPALPNGSSGARRFYDLSAYYCYVATGDTVTVTGWN